MRFRAKAPLSYLASLATALLFCGAAFAYESPYKIKFSENIQELCACEKESPRNDWRLESETPYADWYSQKVLKKFDSWGPKARTYPPPQNIDGKSASWQRQRLLAVAYRMVGLPYQHHHIPDWNPPADWPWKEVKYGRNSKGLDCSNFTSWVYNYGLGMKFTSDVQRQADSNEYSPELLTAGGTTAKDFDLLLSRLKLGDLLYIMKKAEDKVSHVVMWVGQDVNTKTPTYLVIDCTGEGHKDSNGNVIPVGVNLRPFTPESWYFKRFSHGHRLIKD